MEYIYLYGGIVAFLFALSATDLFVGVGNDAVNFLSSAIGSKAARFKTILIVASIGVFVGAATSSGMMDIARHGIFRPEQYFFEELMCVFLAVVASDVILLDIFNTMGMPTSTTVSMVFELLGGSTALALMKMLHNPGLTYADLINTDKALSVILAIFLSVAIAFVFGFIIQWLARMIFTFNYVKHLKYTIGIFGGISITSIAYFLLVKGIGEASFMTPGIKGWIGDNTTYILLACLVCFTVLMQILHWARVNVFRIIVLFGTFSLAMAFAGNDLVNFIGVTLTGFSSFVEFQGTAGADPSTFRMDFLNESAQTSVFFLLAAGTIMVISLWKSEKAQNVVKTSVDLSRQSAGDEMFGSSRFARRLVRSVLNSTEYVVEHTPKGVKKWVNARFNTDEAIMPQGAAFDLVRASVTLVLAGLLIVIGTSLKLPLSTTYVAFMVGMGSSLADRAWSRESAVFRVTGVISVIGGWFMTAGAAFFMCFIVTLVLHFGGIPFMVGVIGLVVFMLVRNQRKYKKKMSVVKNDEVYSELVATTDKEKVWTLLSLHVRQAQSAMLQYIGETYKAITDGLIEDDVKMLRHAQNSLADEKKNWKVIRRKEIFGMRKIDTLQAVEKNTWFHLGNNSTEQSLYCLRRMCEPILEHVDNNFNPLPQEYQDEFEPLRKEVLAFIESARAMIASGDYSNIIPLRDQGDVLKNNVSELRNTQQHRITHDKDDSMLKVQFLYLNTLQETQELIGHMRHLVRAGQRFQE